jgi:excisionase family DNA binding protein
MPIRWRGKWWYSVAEAARIRGVSKSTVYRRLHSGRVKAIKVTRGFDRRHRVVRRRGAGGQHE